jgi:hypothetical protein
MDCVNADGSGFIGYAARAGYGGFGVNILETLCWQADGGAAGGHISLGGALPKASAEGISWSSRALHVNGRWRSTGAPALSEILLDGRKGRIEWTCLSTAAPARVTAGSREYDGDGYVERLAITLPLAELPIRELRWGRFISGAQSCVWIRWDGKVRRNLCFHNGRPVDATAEPTGLAWPGHQLRLEAGIVIRSGRIASGRVHGARWVRLLLPSAVRNICETKWCSRGVLADAHGDTHSGWAVHEVVVFP